jgi:nitrite reductase (cytochrome c-552)
MERKEMTTKSALYKKFIVVAAVCVMVIALVSLVACQQPATNTGGGSGSGSTAPEAPKGTPSPAATPTAAKNENGVWVADAWKDIYPNQYKTFDENKMNKTEGSDLFVARESMIELYPELVAIWNPSPFTKWYNEPNGHPYTLDDVRASGRIFDTATQTYKPTAFANCYTCKSADYTALLQAQYKGGADVTNPGFGDAAVGDKVNEPVSCWNCHENNLATDNTEASLKVTQPFFTTGEGKVDEGSRTCGQCHNEYYFKPADRSVQNPYSTLENMNAEDMYEFYKTAGAEGKPFNDYVNPLTQVGQLKGQHPEFEFVFGDGGSSMTKRINPQTGETFGCADCHMGNKVVENGVEYTSHLLISPLKNEELLKTTCETPGCHADASGKGTLETQVNAWKKESEDKVHSVGKKIEDLTKKLADAVAAGSLDDAKKAEISELNRQAVWYWDFVMVENSEGSHNPTLSNKLLGLSEDAADDALKLLG